jgi:hypothetical protein
LLAVAGHEGESGLTMKRNITPMVFGEPAVIPSLEYDTLNSRVVTAPVVPLQSLSAG